MQGYRLVLKEKLYSFKNILRILLIKFPLQLILILLLIFGVLYLFNQIIYKEFSGLKFASGINIFKIFKLFIKDFILILNITVFSILMFSYKSTLSYWIKVNNLSLSIDSVYLAYLTYYFIGFSSIIILPLIFILNTINASFIQGFTLLFIILTIITGYVFLFISIYKLISSKIINKFLYFTISILILGIVSLLLIIFFLNTNFNEYRVLDFIIISLPLLISLVLLAIQKNKNIILYDYKVYSQRLIKNTKIVKITENHYVSILILEIIRNWKLYLKFVSLPIGIILIYELLITYGDITTSYFSIASIATVSVGLYNSYIESFKLLPIKQCFNIIIRAIFTFSMVTFVFIINSIIHNSQIKYSHYTEVILTSILMFLITYLTKIPLIKNGKENSIFYLFAFLIPNIYKTTFMIITSFINDAFNFTINFNYCSLILILILITLTFTRGDISANIQK